MVNSNELLYGPAVPLVLSFCFAVVAGHKGDGSSWAVSFTPMYIMDVFFVLAYLSWRGSVVNSIAPVRMAVYALLIVSKIAADILLPLRLDGVITTQYSLVVIPICIVLVLLFIALVMDIKRRG